MKTTIDERRQTVEAVAHFVVLMHARERGEFATAALEQAALERIGVRVRFCRPKPAKEVQS